MDRQAGRAAFCVGSYHSFSRRLGVASAFPYRGSTGVVPRHVAGGAGLRLGRTWPAAPRGCPRKEPFPDATPRAAEAARR